MMLEYYTKAAQLEQLIQLYRKLRDSHFNWEKLCKNEIIKCYSVFFFFFVCHTKRNFERITRIYLYSIYIHIFMPFFLFGATFHSTSSNAKTVHLVYHIVATLGKIKKWKQRCCIFRYGNKWQGDWIVTAAIFQLSNQNIKPITFND